MDCDLNGGRKGFADCYLTGIQLDAIKPKFGINALFQPIVIPNTEGNGFIEGTPITITAIDTAAHTITLSWLPNIDTVCAPVATQEWIVAMGRVPLGQSEPSLVGQDQSYLKITSGNSSTRVLNYSVTDIRNITMFTVGARVYFYNIFNNGWNFNFGQTTSLIPKRASTYYSGMLGPGGVYKHSSGTYRMVVNGYNGTNWTVGLFSSSDLIHWTSISSIAKITYSPGTWRVNGIHVTSVIKHPTENKYFGMAYGQETTPVSMYRLGWVKFDENMENIEYAPAELAPTTGLNSGLIDPSIIYYKGKYRIIACARVDAAVSLWEMREYRADLPEGPYTQVLPLNIETIAIRNIHTCYRSDHTQQSAPFILNNELYALVDGTSQWYNSGTRGERMLGLMKFNDSSQIWEPLTGGVYWGSYQFAAPLWSRPGGHTGGSPVIYTENNNFYIYAALTIASNQYEVVGACKFMPG